MVGIIKARNMLCPYLDTNVREYNGRRMQNKPDTHRKQNDRVVDWKTNSSLLNRCYICKFSNPSLSKPSWSSSDRLKCYLHLHLIVKLDILLLRKWNFRLKSQTAWIWAFETIETIMWLTCIIMTLNVYIDKILCYF